jgi:hypothetical protein
MDPVSLIVAALAAGAVAGTQNTATEAVKDAYTGLKTLVQRHLRGHPAGEIALEQHAAKPEQWDKALEAELVEVDAGSDAPTVEAAQRLMALLDAPGTRSGRYVVDARGARGVQVGDGNTMHNTF